MSKSDPLAGLSGPDRDAYAALTALFAKYGLSSLAPKILDYVKQGYSQSTVSLLLQDTKEWKDRFAGNELLKKQGLGELDPATYLDMERSYSAVLKQFGIPAGMYGQSDFAHWIGGSVSASEIQSRVQMAADAQYNSDQYFRSSLEQFGIDTGHQIAYFMDQSRALPYLQRQFQAAQIGSSALRHNLKLDPAMADTLAALGISGSQAEQGYTTIGQELDPMKKLAGLNGEQFGQNDYEKALFEGDADAVSKARRAQQSEAARFSGSAGALPNSNARSLQGAY